MQLQGYCKSQEIPGGMKMGKVETNKKRKKNALFQTAYELFTDKGFAKTTISDIVNKAGLAKGTFYLYFKDKYDLRDRLIAYQAGKLFEDAHKELDKKEINSFEEEVLFLTDYIIGRFEKQHSLMQFIAKNLSWGIFKNAFSSTEFPEAQGFYEHYLEAISKFNVKCEEPELLLFTIIELLGSTSYNCILYKQPVTMQEYLPHLHRILHQLLIAFTEEA